MILDKKKFANSRRVNQILHLVDSLICTGVWKSRNPESGIRNPESGTGAGNGTGTGTGF